MKMNRLFGLFFLLLSVACTETEKKAVPSSNETTTSVVPQEVDATAALALVKESPEMIILDIRTPAEFAAGHLVGAKNVDFSASNFEDALSPLDRKAAYLMHCQSGGRSGQALPIFQKLGFENIIHLSTGFADWAYSGYPVEK